MLISVVCPVFNTKPELLLAAARSVLEEDGSSRQCELILVDDASTDADTLNALQMLEDDDSRIRVVHAHQNKGPAAARNLGIAMASHEWIGFIDADDLWAEGRLVMFRQATSRYPNASWFAGSQVSLGKNNILTPGPLLAEGNPDEGSALIKTPALTKCLIANWLHLGTSVIKKSVIDAAGGFDESLRYGEDWLLFLRLSVQTPLVAIAATAYILRRQGESLMHSSGRLTRNFSRAPALARRDPALRMFRRELRWFHYGVCKDMAMNNLLNARKERALVHALRALLISPGDFGEFIFFCRQFASRNGEAVRTALHRYSKAEQVKLVPPILARPRNKEILTVSA